MVGAVENVSPPVVAPTTTLNVNAWVLSSAGPALMLVANPVTVCKPPLKVAAGGLPASENVGASLTALTLMATVSVSLFGPSGPVAPLSFVTTVSDVLPEKLTGDRYDNVASLALMAAIGPE